MESVSNRRNKGLNYLQITRSVKGVLSKRERSLIVMP